MSEFHNLPFARDFGSVFRHIADATNKVNILEDNPIIFFSQKKRPLEADISDNLKNAEEFFFMARTGVNFLGSHKSDVCHAIDNGCVCKFLIVNQHSPAIDYGQLRPIVDRKNVPVSYQWLQEIKEYDKGRNRVEIRVLNNFPPFGIEYFKKKDGKKIINVRPYFLTNYEPEKRPLLMVKEHSEAIRLRRRFAFSEKIGQFKYISCLLYTSPSPRD